MKNDMMTVGRNGLGSSSVDATSAASRRLISVAGNTIIEKDASLTDKNAENVIFLRVAIIFWPFLHFVVPCAPFSRGLPVLQEAVGCMFLHYFVLPL